jgi:plasmid maintenance system antidote protein VapI
MKKYKVYFLKDKNGEIKYVGQTRSSLAKRHCNHRTQKGRLSDRFHTIHLVDSFDNPEEMYALEAKLIDELDLVSKGWNKEYGKIKLPKSFDASGENNGFYKHSHSEKNRKLISKRNTGNKYAIGNTSRRGLKNSEYHNSRISYVHSKPIFCPETSTYYKSGKEASKILGVSRARICDICKGKRKSTKNYTFIYLNDLFNGPFISNNKMQNSFNCWKLSDETISSEASKEERSTTIAQASRVK